MSQCSRIYWYLHEGHTLTPAAAYVMFGTLALHSRIAELRGRGHRINCELIEIGDKRVGQYSMAAQRAAA